MTAVRVGVLYKACSLKIRNLDLLGFALSDCCQRHATAVVITPSGDRLWRCAAHRWNITLGDFGDSSLYVDIKQDSDADLY